MSTSGFVVVRLDALSAEEREHSAQNAIEWLTRQGVLASLATSLWGHHEHALGEWGPGPGWEKAAVQPIPPGWESSPGEEVAISSGCDVVTAMGNSEDFTCARCGTPISSGDALGGLIEQWLEDGEPIARCAACGWAAPLGDWPSEYPPGLVGGPAVTFYRWPPFDPGFIDGLISRLGGRCRTFWTHF